MSANPFFSVVIPSFKSAETVGEAVRSALSQRGVDLEVIVIVDGSPQDDDLEATNAGAGDPRLRVIRIPNGGVSLARNIGAGLAQGRYLAFLDADDMLLPGALKAHADALVQNPDTDLSFGRVLFWRPGDQDKGRTSSFEEFLPLPMILGDNQISTASNIVVHRDRFIEVGGFNTNLRLSEDQEFLGRFALSGKTLRGIDQLTIRYRTSEDGLSSDLDKFNAAWNTMLDGLVGQYPLEIAPHLDEIEARFGRYRARRKVRLGISQPADGAKLTRLLLRCPMLVLKEPKRSLLTLIAAFLPTCLRVRPLSAALSR